MEESTNTNIEQEKPWWAIFVDIEGYSKKEQTEGRELSLLLADDVCKIASQLPNNRLGFYQFGADGFLITQQGTSSEFSLAISISIALLRMALKYNSVRKVKISYGNLGDYSNFYKDLPQKYNGTRNGDCIYINQSLVVLAPALMGDGLLNAYNLQCRSGPLLCVDNIYENEVKELELKILASSSGKSMSINWLSALGNIENQISKFVDGSGDLVSQYKKYLTEKCTNLSANCEWLKNANSLLE